MATLKTFWLSYDLGLQGDYANLYAWLDNHKAKECGDSLALFQFLCKNQDEPEQEILKDLTDSVTFSKRDRIYLVWMERREPRKLKGKFLVGGRKSAPWEGYGNLLESSLDVIDE